MTARKMLAWGVVVLFLGPPCAGLIWTVVIYIKKILALAVLLALGALLFSPLQWAIKELEKK